LNVILFCDRFPVVDASSLADGYEDVSLDAFTLPSIGAEWLWMYVHLATNGQCWFSSNRDAAVPGLRSPVLPSMPLASLT
jgi:hypothetical protein